MSVPRPPEPGEGAGFVLGLLALLVLLLCAAGLAAGVALAAGLSWIIGA